jgi:hypothetical protein
VSPRGASRPLPVTHTYTHIQRWIRLGMLMTSSDGWPCGTRLIAVVSTSITTTVPTSSSIGFGVRISELRRYRDISENEISYLNSSLWVHAYIPFSWTSNSHICKSRGQAIDSQAVGRSANRRCSHELEQVSKLLLCQLVFERDYIPFHLYQGQRTACLYPCQRRQMPRKTSYC